MPRELTIAGHRIADDEPCYVIAEIGSNHGGSIEIARALVDAASTAGADIVKFQKRDNPRLYSSALLNAPYVNEHSYGDTYGAHREALELTVTDLERIFQDTLYVPWFATAFDELSADELNQSGVPAIKVHSGGLADGPLLKHIARFHKPIILSTGGGTIDDIDRAVRLLGDCPHAILHCTASYPLNPKEANLRVIPVLRNRYPNTVIGWSSHATGPALSLVAYALGARIIEHHFTLNRAGKGTDHAFSLEPGGLKWLVDELKKARLAMGDGIKRFYESERKPIAKMRRVQTEEGWRITG